MLSILLRTISKLFPTHLNSFRHIANQFLGYCQGQVIWINSRRYFSLSSVKSEWLLDLRTRIRSQRQDIDRLDDYSTRGIGAKDKSLPSNEMCYTLPLRNLAQPFPCSSSLAVRKPTTGILVLIIKLEEMTLRELSAIAKLAQTGLNLGCP
jgi:hypothetical protein